MTYHVCVNVFVDPGSTPFSKTKIQEVVSHSTSHGVTTHDNGKTTIIIVHFFDAFHGLGQIPISRFGAHGRQSPAIEIHKRQKNKQPIQQNEIMMTFLRQRKIDRMATICTCVLTRRVPHRDSFHVYIPFPFLKIEWYLPKRRRPVFQSCHRPAIRML